MSSASVTAWCEELRLDLDLLPPQPSKVDAFRVATSEARVSYRLPQEGHTATLRVAEVRADDEQVTRHVLREVTDGRGSKTVTEQVATLKFFRGARTARGKRHAAEHWKFAIKNTVAKDDREHVAELIEQVDERYTALCTDLHAEDVRGLVRRHLERVHAVGLAHFAVYFVLPQHEPLLAALRTLLSRVGQGSVLHYTPLVDGPDARAMLTGAFRAELEADCRRLHRRATELLERVRTRAYVRPSELLRLQAEHAVILDRADEYAGLDITPGIAAPAMQDVAEVMTKIGMVRR